MKNMEIGSNNNISEEFDLSVGAKKNIDGTLDYSKAVTWNNVNQEAEQVKTIEFQEYIKVILSFLDKLEKVLKTGSKNPDWFTSGAKLNINITGITSYVNVISKVNKHEYDAIMNKAIIVEREMSRALSACNVAKVKWENHMGGSYINKSIFLWLEEEGPNVLESLKNLKIQDS